MANDFIVRLSGDSKNYQSAMEQAKRSLDNFQKQNLSTNSVMKTLTGTLGKYVSAAAALKGAQEAVTRVMHGSQTTADAWQRTMHAAKVTVDNFFSSLSTGDFTSFLTGLDSIIRKAKDAADAMDRLGNASMSWNYFQSARMAELTELQNIAKTGTPEERTAALERMRSIQSELGGMAQGFEERAIEAMAKRMTAATGVSWQNASRADLEKILRLDLMSINSSEAEKARLGAQYAEYQSRLSGLENYKRQYTYNGTTHTEVDPEKKKRYDEQAQALAREYQDAILYNEVLVRKSDDWLQELIAIVQKADAAAQAMKRVNNAVRETENSLGGTTTTPVVTSASPKSLAITTPSLMESINQKQFQSSLKSYRKMSYIETPESLEHLNAQMRQMTNQSSNIKDLASSWSQLGAAMQGTGDDALAAVGSIIQAVATAVPAFETLAASAAAAAGAEGVAETPTLAGKIAAAATLTATMLSMISTLKNVDSYAEGGIVGGRNYTDGISARVSSGEMVINEADQKKLYDTIHSGVGGGAPVLNLSVYGEQLLLAINNHGRRMGYGTLQFSRG